MKVFCILSDERAHHSKSPLMFSRVLNRMGINGTYVPFKVEPGNIGQAIQGLRILNIAGINITVPYKEAVIPYLDDLSEGANIIGAINTIVCNGGIFKGYNTNAVGIMDALTNQGFDPEGKTALVFGTGGAARAVVFILNWMRTHKVYVAGRNPDKINEIVDRFGGEGFSLEDLREREHSINIIVNTTAVSSDEESPEMSALINNMNINDCELIMDLNYGRIQNFWRDMANKMGIQFMDGLLPLAYQARRTFALWTKLQVPPEEFIKALNGEPE